MSSVTATSTGMHSTDFPVEFSPQPQSLGPGGLRDCTEVCEDEQGALQAAINVASSLSSNVGTVAFGLLFQATVLDGDVQRLKFILLVLAGTSERSVPNAATGCPPWPCY